MSLPSAAAQDAVETLAREAGAIALDHFARVASLPVTMKGHLDLVTEADQAVERFIASELRQLFPEDGVLGEEGSGQDSRSGRLWVVDPIDGTANFVRGNDQWAVSIGLFEGGHPRFGVIHAPVRGQTFRGGPGQPATLNGIALPFAQPLDPSRALIGISLHPATSVEKRLATIRHIIGAMRLDFRTCGASTITLMDMATGQLDGYVCDGIASWDVMAALPILESLGHACSLDWSRIALTDKIGFACGTEAFLQAMAPVIEHHHTLPPAGAQPSCGM